MFRYEIFRLSVPGWFLISCFIMISYPYLEFENYSTEKWIVLFVASLLLSPVFGYLTNQIIYAFMAITNTRPNDVKLNVRKLHEQFIKITTELDYRENAIIELYQLSPKELHRFIWVAYANKELRDRSESTWERYYTNLNIIFVSIFGSVLAIVMNVPRKEALVSGNIIKYTVIIVFTLILWYNNKKYLKICVNIENAWIDSFLRKLKIDCDFLFRELFRR